jgi:serine/threonine-protein phosphatase 2A catalytic subunit
MDNNMEIDSGRSPEPHGLAIGQDAQSIPTLDGWIESLMTCKQLPESDVQRLCDRVRRLEDDQIKQSMQC